MKTRDNYREKMEAEIRKIDPGIDDLAQRIESISGTQDFIDMTGVMDTVQERRNRLSGHMAELQGAEKEEWLHLRRSIDNAVSAVDSALTAAWREFKEKQAENQ